MVQNRNNQQGNQQRGGNQSPRRVISLKSITEETVAGGAKRVLLQARVESGRKPFSSEPLVLTTTRPTGASNQFGGFIEEATQLAHWSVMIPAGEEHTFQVTDGDGNISLPLMVSAKAAAQQKPKPTSLKVEVVAIEPGRYNLAISVRTEGGGPVPAVPVFVRYQGVQAGDLTTDENGRCTHAIAVTGSSLNVVVECENLESWHTRLFAAASTETPQGE